eukprot:7441158-Pyramimonas_sp.AAC.1
MNNANWIQASTDYLHHVHCLVQSVRTNHDLCESEGNELRTVVDLVARVRLCTTRRACHPLCLARGRR